MSKVTLYVVVNVENYIPEVDSITLDYNEAIERGKALAKNGDVEWDNAKFEDTGEVYFNQKEEGNMEEAVSVQERTIELKGLIPVSVF